MRRKQEMKIKTAKTRTNEEAVREKTELAKAVSRTCFLSGVYMSVYPHLSLLLMWAFFDSSVD